MLLHSLLMTYIGPIVSDKVPCQVAAIDVPRDVDYDTLGVLRANFSYRVVEVSEGKTKSAK